MYRLFYNPDVLDCYTLINDEDYRIHNGEKNSHMKGVRYYYGLSFSKNIVSYCEHTEVVIDDNEEGIGEEVSIDSYPCIQYIINNIF